MRTYGTYQHLTQDAASELIGKYERASIPPSGAWAVKAEPAVTMRLKRTFGRVRATRSGAVLIGHTAEVARDLDWFMERYPLTPVDEHSLGLLTVGANEHRDREEDVAAILSGTYRAGETLTLPTVEPRPYQQAAVDLLRRVGGLLLTDELGLGKTTTACLNLLHDDALPAVVVAPAHLAAARGGRWTDELTEHFPHLRFHVARTTKPYDLTDRDGRQPDVLILTYSKLAGWVDVLCEWANYVIFEEVHELRRGADTVKGTAAAQLADRVRYRLGLTATPVYNYAGEAHSIMQIIAPGSLGTRDEFIREWGQTSWSNHVKVADPAALGSYLREQGVMLGRTRKEVGRELPKTIKVTQLVESDTTALDAVAGDAAALARLILDSTTTSMDRFRASGEIDMLMRQATGLAKAPFVAEFVRLLLESEEKIVLFGWHRAVYDIWLDRLAEFHPVLYTGTESPNQKGAALDAFKNGDARILIMSLRSGSGVDGLQKVARVAVFGELDWSPQVHEQGIGRLRRDGIDEPPVAYFLVSEEGSDPAIAEVLQVKRQQGEQMVSPDGRLFENATADLNRTRMLAEAAIARAGGAPR
ncbi:DEAD/DEAH box helicase [Cellulomonas sp. C5510]|uniref:SNF2-related protein n=1 Tax=Cellulomonas sp. C5510 TaxID=2871170 RepID=UPI001C9481F6|nr:DEAD/DEAH box helicase [Cellulomonas sp. C5510]QZN86905.1 DEAD/DEAH box helicase [Cellulomonas sp. C5510]